MQALREYKDNDGYKPTDSWLQIRDRKKLEKQEKQKKILTEDVHKCTAGQPIYLTQLLTQIQGSPRRTPKLMAILSRRCSSHG
jgi:hypothetical protein